MLYPGRPRRSRFLPSSRSLRPSVGEAAAAATTTSAAPRGASRPRKEGASERASQAGSAVHEGVTVGGGHFEEAVREARPEEAAQAWPGLARLSEGLSPPPLPPPLGASQAGTCESRCLQRPPLAPSSRHHHRRPPPGSSPAAAPFNLRLRQKRQQQQQQP